MAIANLFRAAPLTLLFVTTSVFAQAAPPPPPAAEAPAPPPPPQEVPQMQLEAPVEHVVAPPPVTTPPRLTYAEPPPVQAPALPACDQHATPSPCEQPSDAYRHDGFYLRLTMETGYLGYFGKGPEGNASVKGLGTGGTLAFGGTPLPGLVVAGTLSSESLRGKFNGRPDGERDRATMALAMIGVLVDWYPQPDDGWHVGAALGFAGISLSDSGAKDSAGVAFSAKLFGGYDWWIGPQWSLGLAAVVAATPSASLQDRDGDKTGYRFHTFSAGVAWTLSLH